MWISQIFYLSYLSMEPPSTTTSAITGFQIWVSLVTPKGPILQSSLHNLEFHFHHQRSIQIFWETILLVSLQCESNHDEQKDNKKPTHHQPQCFLPLSEAHKHLNNRLCVKFAFDNLLILVYIMSISKEYKLRFFI